MNRVLKKLLTTTLAVSLLSSCLIFPASAAIPQDYWQYHTLYQNVKSGDDAEAIISVCLDIEAVMLTVPMDSDVASILYNSYNSLYQAYESLYDYESAIHYLELLIPCAEYLGFDDAIKLAERRMDMIDPMTQVYALTDNVEQSPYYGEMYEPVAGAYYGRTYSYSGYSVTAAESATSVYVEFLQEDIADFDWYIGNLDQGDDHILHVALNMPNENSDLATVLTSDSYINSMMYYLADLDCPVFLRIGGEMNVWTDLADPTAYKAAFIKIANAARSIAPNVALVFSPNYISNWTVDITDYYPGDQYVDWIGISNYTNMYASGKSPSTGVDYEEAYYGRGIYASPITSIKYIVEEFGDTKPIMITEGASGYQTSTGLDLTSFASFHMQQMYTYLNMVYPQVKAIIYFDTNVASSGYQYALSSNSTLYSAYLSATAANPTLLNTVEDGTLTYVTAGEYLDDMDTITLSAFCNPVGDPTVTVSYVLDGTTVKTTTASPYTYNLSASALSQGTHTLTVKFSTADGYSATKTYSITKGSDNLVAIVEGTTPVTLPDSTTPAATTATAVLSSTNLQVNGQAVAVQAYMINDNNYIKLRDLATMINGTGKNFEVTWNETLESIEMKSNSSYTSVGGEMATDGGQSVTATLTTSPIYLDGVLVELTAYNIADNNYFKLRDVMELFDVGVGYDDATETASLDTSLGYTG